MAKAKTRAKVPKLVQYIPEGPFHPFEVYGPLPAALCSTEEVPLLDRAHSPWDQMVTVTQRAAQKEWQPGESNTYWHFRIADSTTGADLWWEWPEPRYFDRPEFRYSPPKKGCPFSVDELALAVAGHMADASGWLTVNEFQESVCVFAAVYAGNGRQVYCIWSTDSSRAKPVGVRDLAARARVALTAARAERDVRYAQT